MHSLRNQVDRCRHAQWALAGLALAVSVAFYAFGYRPSQRQLESLNASVEVARQELGRADAGALTAGGSGEDWLALRQRLGESRKLTQPYEPEQFVRSLAVGCEQSGLRRLTVQSGVLRRAGLLSELPVLVQFEGNFLDAASFLRQLDQMPWLTRVKGLRVRSAAGAWDGGGGEVEVQLSLRAYSSEE